jgi:putative copper export protein
VATEFVGFVASFLAAGAVGFRYAAIRDRLTRTGTAAPAFYGNATQRAAMIGLLGAVVQAVMLARQLPHAAERAHVSVSQLVTTSLPTAAQCALLAAVVVGLTLAAMRWWPGWRLAAIGVIAGPLTGILAGQWTRLPNPVHRLVGGLWIGTLFVLVVAGLGTLLRDRVAAAQRGEIAANLVNGFSPLALAGGGILVLSGLTTGWQHLNPLSSLWSTPYGYALLAKLAVVAVVFALGAWNWRRQRPTLGSESAAIAVRRSSVRELVAATVVLVLTAIVVSLPSPRPPKPPAASAPPGTATGAVTGGG